MCRTFIFYWICLVAVHIMLLVLVSACKGVLGPLDLLCECMCGCVFFRSIWPAIEYLSCTYWFFCGAAVSPAAFCLSRLQLCKSKKEKKKEGGRMGRSREVGGRERSGYRLWEKSRISYLLGFDDCCIFKAVGIYYIYTVYVQLKWYILVKEGWFVFELKRMFLSTGKH